MSYISLGTKLPWGTEPDITLSISYDYRRNGADMQYKIKVYNIKLPWADSRFGFPIYGKVYLNNSSKASASKTIKNASPSRWDPGDYIWETEWLTVSNKTSGSTRLKVNIYSGLGENRDKTYSYDLTVTAAAVKISSLNHTSIDDDGSVTIVTTPEKPPEGYSLQYCLASEAGKGADIIGWQSSSTLNLSLASANKTKMYEKDSSATKYQPWVYVRTINGQGTQIGAADKKQITVTFKKSAPTIEVNEITSSFNTSKLNPSYKTSQYIYTNDSVLTVKYNYTIRKNGLCKSVLVNNSSIPNPTSKIYKITNYTAGSTIQIVDSRGWKSNSSQTLIPSKYTIINDYFIPSLLWDAVPTFTVDTSATGQDKVSISGKIKTSYSTTWNHTSTNPHITYSIKNAAGTKIETGTVQNNTISISSLDYSDRYTIEVQFIDDILKEPLTLSYSGNVLPVFDFSQTDFNFNVPISINTSNFGHIILHRNDAEKRPSIKFANSTTQFGAIYMAANENLKTGCILKKSDYNGSEGETILDTELVADYVVEKGTSGNWTYRKWNSGMAECWLTAGYITSDIPSTMTANGALYESNTMTLALPTGLFSNTPNVSIDTMTGGGMWLKATGSTTKDSIVYEMLRTNNTKASVNMSIQCKGKWK